MNKIVVLLTTLMYLSTLGILAQSRTVTGQVTDESGAVMPFVTIMNLTTKQGVVSNERGNYSINVTGNNDILHFSSLGMKPHKEKVDKRSVVNVILKEDVSGLDEVVVTGCQSNNKFRPFRSSKRSKLMAKSSHPQMAVRATGSYSMYEAQDFNFNTENYASINENGYKQVSKQPLSTFSVDVDRASYSNIRRFLNNGQMPPADAVRIEEMINYFDYDYDQPQGDDPFSIHPEIATCPWNEAHYLLKVGLKGKAIEKDNLPPSNLVFLIDVSGSMNHANKLPLLKSSFRLLVNELRPEDYVSIVVYAGAAGCVLEPTSGKNKQTILNALDQLQAGGSTAGGAGLKLAYKKAKENYQEHANNRIIIATDGDFNVGQSSNAAMEDLVAQERDNGIFMTVLGFGMGNYKDDRMEIIADKGNGNYAYIDNLQEAQKTLVSEFGGTLFTIAKDVKFQLEFNPNNVLAYRLIGYENRLLNDEDFNDDKKDAGEIGAGHTVTALYEIIPVGAEDSKQWVKSIDPLKYQKNVQQSHQFDDEWLTLKLRYKQPDASNSQLIVQTVKGDVKDFNEASQDFQFSASVAAFGMLLRNSEYKEDLNYTDVYQMAKKARGNDEQGFKAEMVRLVKTAESISQNYATNE